MGGLEYHNGDSLAAGLGDALRRATLGGGESIFGRGLHRRTLGSDRCSANPDVDNSEVIGRAPLRDRRWRSTGTGQDSLPPAGCHIMRRSRSHPHHLITTASTAAGTKVESCASTHVPATHDVTRPPHVTTRVIP